MGMPGGSALYDDGDEAAMHGAAIELLAREIGQPIDAVRRVYEGEFARLKRGARIKNFLVFFASRRTRDTLAGRG
ncbi:MAG TPA: DUF3562 domain-containing protein [Burkholderiaceae bacterium]|nr:DUF3562 domain-containing protein [Burkholderiaceae bacterium]